MCSGACSRNITNWLTFLTFSVALPSLSPTKRNNRFFETPLPFFPSPFNLCTFNCWMHLWPLFSPEFVTISFAPFKKVQPHSNFPDDVRTFKINWIIHFSGKWTSFAAFWIRDFPSFYAWPSFFKKIGSSLRRSVPWILLRNAHKPRLPSFRFRKWTIWKVHGYLGMYVNFVHMAPNEREK